jgi:hypothetical protein
MARVIAVVLTATSLGVVGAGITAGPAAADTCEPIRYWHPPVNDYVITGEVCGVLGIAPSTVTWTTYYSIGCEEGSTPSKMRVAWGDGQYLDFVLSDPDNDPSGGTWCFSVTTLSGSHTYTAPGTYVPNIERQYNGSWQISASQLFVVRVLASNTAPVATDDSFVVASNTSTTLAVLVNDSDAESAVTIDGWSSPSHGSAWCSDVTCTYAPTAGYTGSDAFTYSIVDNFGSTDSATVTINVLDANAAITGTVTTGGSPVGGATVRACIPGVTCQTDLTAGDGTYTIAGLIPGAYQVAAVPAASASLAASAPVVRTLAGGETGNADFDLMPLDGLPPNVTFGSSTTGEIPSVPRGVASAVTTEACPNGAGTYLVNQNGGVLHSGVLVESPSGSGSYVGSIPPSFGVVGIVLTVTCPDATEESASFAAAYIDPSGNVRTPRGAPVAGATVTLLHAEHPADPFVPVPDGSAVMSPANRDNPSITTTDGAFGWDVVPGYYKVRAEKDGCHAPLDPTVTYVESAVLTIPPEVTDLDLRLACPRLSIGDVTISEGDGGTRRAQFVVTLDEPSLLPITVSYSLVSQSGTVGSDVVERAGIVTFKLNKKGWTPVAKVVTVKVNGDTAVEDDELFAVQLSQSSAGVALERAVGYGTILNDDPNGGPMLSIGSASVGEGNVGVRLLKIPVTLSAPTTQNVTATVTTTAGSATGGTRPGSGVDYKSVTRTVTISAGATGAVLSIRVFPDSSQEDDETVSLSVTNLVGASLGSVGGATILDDD